MCYDICNFTKEKDNDQEKYFGRNRSESRGSCEPAGESGRKFAWELTAEAARQLVGGAGAFTVTRRSISVSACMR